MSTTYEKECVICGRLFTTPTKKRMYCDDCLHHQKRNTKDIAFAQARARAYMGPKVLEFECSECGTKFKSIRKLLFSVSAQSSPDGKAHDFCSDKCRSVFKHRYATCRWCGKSLADNPNYDPHNWYSWYCDDKCREEERWDIARKTDNLHTCPICGKEFIDKKTTFCSKECYREAVNRGWDFSAGEPAPKVVKRKCECPVCHRRWIKTYINPTKDGLSKPVVCSKACAGVFAKRLVKEKAEKERLLAEAARHTEEEKKQKELREQIRKEIDLCASCKVSYKDCERMQSEFRVIPEGARYNERGKLVECPKYKQ